MKTTIILVLGLLFIITLTSSSYARETVRRTYNAACATISGRGCYRDNDRNGGRVCPRTAEECTEKGRECTRDGRGAECIQDNECNDCSGGSRVRRQCSRR